MMTSSLKQLFESPCVCSLYSYLKKVSCWYAMVSAQHFCCFFHSRCSLITGHSSMYVCGGIWGRVYVGLHPLAASLAELTYGPFFMCCQGEMLAAPPVGFGIQECETGSTCLGRDTGTVYNTSCSYPNRMREMDRPPWH